MVDAKAKSAALKNAILRWMLEIWDIFGKMVQVILQIYELEFVIYKRIIAYVYPYKGKTHSRNATACSHQLQIAQSHHPSTGLILTLTPSLGLVVIPPLIFIFAG